jgi:signal transduction histidine kinase
MRMSEHRITVPTPDADRGARQSFGDQLLALLLRPTAPPLWLGLVVAAGFITGETLLVHRLQQISAGTNAYGAVFLLGVLVVSAGWDFLLAVGMSLTSALVYVYFHLGTGAALLQIHAQDAYALTIFLPIALLANILAGQARLRTAEAEQRRREADLAAELAHALAEQQAALRRVATLVARGTKPSDVYPAVMAELSRGLGADNVALLRYEADDALVLLATRDGKELAKMSIGERLSLRGENVAAMIRDSGAPARMDSFDGATGKTAARIRALGLLSAVGAPIVVDGRIWGALVVGSSQPEPLAPHTEARIGDFAELIATAISNAETRAELTASRARIVAAGDQARRRFERDLHDGAQQRVVSLGLELREIEASIPTESQELCERLAHVVAGLAGVSADLQEISRGIHPAILSKGGLGPAIKTLARRSAVPVDLDLHVDRRLPESVEVAAYYVVAEALTNVAKHAQASAVTICATVEDKLRLVITDDGVGGAVAGGGSGLIGLKDRVEALAGGLDVSSPAGSGTTLVVTIPL